MTKQDNTNTPLIFFMFGFFVIILGIFSKYFLQVDLIGQSVQRKKMLPITPTNKPLKMKIDFSRTVVCNYIDQTASISAIMQNTNVFAQSEKSSLLLIDDCVYVWDRQDKNGTKKCGVSQYVQLGRSLLSSGMLNNTAINEMLNRLGNNMTPVNFDAQNFLDSCKNEEIYDKKIFTVPSSIQFNN